MPRRAARRSNSSAASAAPSRCSACTGMDCAAASATAARSLTAGSTTRLGWVSASWPAQYAASRVRPSRLMTMPAISGRPPRRSAMRDTFSRICSTPSALQAAGSATMITASAANSALTVNRPSDGGQSMMTSSKSSTTPDSATARRSWAPMTSIASWCSRWARRGELGATLTVERMGSIVQDESVRMSRSDPGRSASSAASIVAAASHTPSPVVELACGSRSTTSTRRPCAAAAAARPSETVVLPTPPFWFTTAVTPMGSR